MSISRRRLLQGTIGASILTGLAWFKPNDLGSGHNEYFEKLSRALKKAELTKPTLILDKHHLENNINTLMQHINQQYNYRIVVKSLPSIPLLNFISTKTNSQRFMVFNESFLSTMLNQFPQGDFLLGKPLSALSCKKVLNNTDHQTGSRIRWLVDNHQRLVNYQQLAKDRSQVLRINLEIDVGLHRGGFSSEQSLSEALQLIKHDPWLDFDGYMGYEPHIVKLPGNANSHLEHSLNIYHRYIELAKNVLGPEYPSKPTFNTAGSPSYQLHTHLKSNTSKIQSQCNELSAGSCLVKPIDFDLPSLADHIPASFIATPILKTLEQTEIPGISGLGKIMAWWNPNLQRSLFTYGGNWKAKPESPAGLTYNPLYGRSSNQEMLNASIRNPLEMNDWVFLRPTQSESVFLQFGDIAIFDGEEISDYWPVFA